MPEQRIGCVGILRFPGLSIVPMEPDPDFLCHDNDTSFDPYRYDREITSPFTFEMLAEELARDLGCDVLWRELEISKTYRSVVRRGPQ